ncbi:MAG: alpha/beta hydrolase [Myxococcota bacterium]
MTLPVDGGEVTVARHLARRDDARTAVVIAGGPGDSSIALLRDLLLGGTYEDPELWLDETWLAIDNRGVGVSDPIACVDSAWFDAMRGLEPVPGDDDAADALRASRDAFRAGCLADRDEASLARLDTATYVADLEALRIATGARELDLLAYSYGTRVAAAYTAAHPDRVGRVVLDSVVAPTATRDGWLDPQAEGFEVSLHRFFERCATNEACAVRDDPEGAYRALLDAAAAAPLPAPTDPAGRSLTRNELRWGVFGLLYYPQDALLGQVLDRARGGDAANALLMADGGWGRDPVTGLYDNVYSASWSIGGTDLPWPEGWTDEDVWAYGAQMEADYPLLGWSTLSGELVCSGWPVRSEPIDFSAPDAPPVLLVNSRYDPATPWANADALREALGNGSVLLTYEGDGHIAELSDASGCIGDAMSRFLRRGALPDDLTCP